MRGIHGDLSGTQVTPVTEDRTTAPFLELGNYAISRHSWMLADGRLLDGEGEAESKPSDRRLGCPCP